MKKLLTRIGCLAGGLALLHFAAGLAVADDAADVKEQLRLLQQQNQALQQQLQQQQQLIQSLDRRLSEVQAEQKHEPEAVAATSEHAGLSFGKIILSGEAGVGFFRTGSDGQFPNSEFRVDEARLFLDAQVMNNVFFFAELNLMTREQPDESFKLGELYIDAEDLSRLWGRDGQLNFRIGRLNTPFGEEYLQRNACDNLLIMHSLSDLWAYDEGAEIYGGVGPFQYVLAIQNGGISAVRDFNADKTLVGRVGYDPTRWLHMSVSAMRTGDLDAQNDMMSALWFGGGFFRSIGAPATTMKFHADLFEGDVALKLPRGTIKAAGGYARYDDNDTSADNQRDIFYYYMEGSLDITRKLYVATRFSQILAPNGYPLVGNGDFGEYFFGPLTRNLWRLSLGAGYRFNQNLVWKVEYMFEQGTQSGGARRNNEDMLATELTGKF